MIGFLLKGRFLKGSLTKSILPLVNEEEHEENDDARSELLRFSSGERRGELTLVQSKLSLTANKDLSITYASD